MDKKLNCEDSWDDSCSSEDECCNVGEQGPKGDQGLNGADGATGAQGTQGPQGLQGFPGIAGNPGQQGQQGIQGAQGQQGVKGDTGEQGPQGPKGDTGVCSCNDAISVFGFDQSGSYTIDLQDKEAKTATLMLVGGGAGGQGSILRLGSPTQSLSGMGGGSAQLAVSTWDLGKLTKIVINVGKGGLGGQAIIDGSVEESLTDGLEGQRTMAIGYKDFDAELVLCAEGGQLNSTERIVNYGGLSGAYAGGGVERSGKYGPPGSAEDGHPAVQGNVEMNILGNAGSGGGYPKNVNDDPSSVDPGAGIGMENFLVMNGDNIEWYLYGGAGGGSSGGPWLAVGGDGGRPIAAATDYLLNFGIASGKVGTRGSGGGGGSFLVYTGTDGPTREISYSTPGGNGGDGYAYVILK